MSTFTIDMMEEAIARIGKPSIKIERGRFEDIDPGDDAYKIDYSVDPGYKQTLIVVGNDGAIKFLAHISPI